MPSTSTEPHWRELRCDTSLPMATMFLNMVFRLPAMVISCTGYAITPSSTQNPAAPRD